MSQGKKSLPSAQTAFSTDLIKHSQGHMHTPTLNNHESKSEVSYANEPCDLKQNFKWSVSAWERTKGKQTM